MNRLKKVLMGIAALAALAAGGATVANATGNDEPSGTSTAKLSGADVSRAGTAASKALGGGRVVSVERSDEGGAAVYEVKIDKGGKVTETQLDRGFSMTSQEADDDQGDAQDKGDGDGDGEAGDDQGDAQDKGDGDGEAADD